MKISDSRQIPHQRLRPFFTLWDRRRGDRPWPRRDEITLDELRSAASNTAFCRIERPYRDLDSLRFVNVGTAIERATGQRITGLTVGELLRKVGSSPEFTFCFSEYGDVAQDGGCTYNEGQFPWPNHNWLTYRRLVMPLGSGAEPEALFVVIDLNAEGLGVSLPPALRDFDSQETIATKPWPTPALQIAPNSSPDSGD